MKIIVFLLILYCQLYSLSSRTIFPKLIGKGKNGTVHQISDTKCLKTTSYRFLNNIKENILCINHPNIISIENLKEYSLKKIITYEMNFIPTSFDYYINNANLYNKKVALLQLILTLAFLHKNKLGYGDLHKNNIKFCQNNNLQIIDTENIQKNELWVQSDLFELECLIKYFKIQQTISFINNLKENLNYIKQLKKSDLSPKDKKLQIQKAQEQIIPQILDSSFFSEVRLDSRLTKSFDYYEKVVLNST